MNEVTRNLVKTSEHLRDKTYLCGEEWSAWDAGREAVGGQEMTEMKRSQDKS